MNTEKWALIAEGKRIRYYVSNLGRCKRENIITGEEKIDCGNRNPRTGYMQFCGGYVHRYVAKAFLDNGNPELWVEVDHIDNDRTNNHADNLRWVSLQHNRSRLHKRRAQSCNHVHHRHDGEIIKGTKRNADGTTETRFWENGHKAARDIGCSHVLVYNAIYHHGSSISAKGWVLQYVSKEGVEK